MEQECIQTSTEGYGSIQYQYDQSTQVRMGNRIFMRYELLDPDSSWCSYFEDITLADLRLAFGHLAQFNDVFEGDEPNPFYLRRGRTWVKAVKISSCYEVEIEAKPIYGQVEIASDHAAFTVETTCPMAKQIGFPLQYISGEHSQWRTRQLEKGQVKNHFLTKGVCSSQLGHQQQPFELGKG
jgi:hypothetical protein